MALKLLASFRIAYRADVFFEPTEQPFDHVALFILWPVEQSRQAWSRLAMHLAQGNDRLHAVAVTVLTQYLAVIALVRQYTSATLTRTTLAAWQADLFQ